MTLQPFKTEYDFADTLHADAATTKNRTGAFVETEQDLSGSS